MPRGPLRRERGTGGRCRRLQSGSRPTAAVACLLGGYRELGLQPNEKAIAYRNRAHAGAGSGANAEALADFNRAVSLRLSRAWRRPLRRTIRRASDGARCSPWNCAGKDVSYSASMEKEPKYVARIDNIYFINRIGASLREATSNVTMAELPENIRLLLRRLKRMEDRANSRTAE